MNPNKHPLEMLQIRKRQAAASVQGKTSMLADAIGPKASSKNTGFGAKPT